MRFTPAERRGAELAARRHAAAPQLLRATEARGGEHGDERWRRDQQQQALCDAERRERAWVAELYTAGRELVRGCAAVVFGAGAGRAPLPEPAPPVDADPVVENTPPVDDVPLVEPAPAPSPRYAAGVAAAAAGAAAAPAAAPAASPTRAPPRTPPAPRNPPRTPPRAWAAPPLPPPPLPPPPASRFGERRDSGTSSGLRSVPRTPLHSAWSGPRARARSPPPSLPSDGVSAGEPPSPLFGSGRGAAAPHGFALPGQSGGASGGGTAPGPAGGRAPAPLTPGRARPRPSAADRREAGDPAGGGGGQGLPPPACPASGPRRRIAESVAAVRARRADAKVYRCRARRPLPETQPEGKGCCLEDIVSCFTEWLR